MPDDEYVTAIVPAEPGWRVVKPLKGEDGKVVGLSDETRVVAWCVRVTISGRTGEAFSFANPIAATLALRSRDDLVLRDPKGSFHVPCILGAISYESVIRHFNNLEGLKCGD
jgi:hypothetical protein